MHQVVFNGGAGTKLRSLMLRRVRPSQIEFADLPIARPANGCYPRPDWGEDGLGPFSLIKLSASICNFPSTLMNIKRHGVVWIQLRHLLDRHSAHANI